MPTISIIQPYSQKDVKPGFQKSLMRQRLTRKHLKHACLDIGIYCLFHLQMTNTLLLLLAHSQLN